MDQNEEANSSTVDDSAVNSQPDPLFLLSLAAMKLSSRTLALALIGIFDTYAWRAMGMVVNPNTGEEETDLDEAKLSIDLVELLLDRLESDMPETDKRDLHRRLSDLRMNYLAQKKEKT